MFSLKNLVGKIVVSANYVEDYFQIGFDDDTGMNIYNKFDLNVHDIRSLVAQKVKNVSDLKKKVIIEFSSNYILEIGMKDEDYFGPEAIEIRTKAGEIIVWN